MENAHLKKEDFFQNLRKINNLQKRKDKDIKY